MEQNDIKFIQQMASQRKITMLDIIQIPTGINEGDVSQISEVDKDTAELESENGDYNVDE